MSTRIPLIALILGSVAALGAAAPPATAAPRTGPVKIESTPPGARILLDDKARDAIGVTPWRGRLPQGTHVVWIELDGHVIHEATIKVGWRWTNLRARLQPVPRPGVLDVRLAGADVAGATIAVDGLDVGAPPRAVEVTAGRHFLEVTAPGRQRYARWIEVDAGARLVIAGELPIRLTTATLVIDADVAQAEVYVDGALIAGSPPLVTEIAAGTHVIEVRRAPALPYLQRVVAKPGERMIVAAKLSASLERSRASKLLVTSAVPAQVAIDQAVKGDTPFMIEELAPGSHLVEVTAPGFATRTEVLEIPAGGTFTLAAELERIAAPVSIVTPLSGARVFVDGAERGTTPWRGSLEHGTHVIRVERPGHAPFTQELEITDAAPQRILARLEAEVVARAAPIAPADVTPAAPTARITGAAAVPRNTYAVSAWLGYPHFLGARVRTGVVDGARPIDVQVGVETYLTHWDLRLGSTTTLVRRDPIQIGAYAAIAGGLATSGRNRFSLDAGGAITLDAGRWFDLTARFGVTVWSDRLCADPDRADPDGLPDSGPRVCRADATPDDLMRASAAVGDTVTDPRRLQDRDWGLLPVIGLAAEIHRDDRMSYWLRLDGFPALAGRPGYRDIFAPVLADRDLGFSLQMGAGVAF